MMHLTMFSLCISAAIVDVVRKVLNVHDLGSFLAILHTNDGQTDTTIAYFT